jgi:CBS-domain-containing membrane protein
MKSCVRDVMTTRVVTVRKNASFKEMIVQMRKSGVGAFPVIDDDGRVIGVVSQADMLDKEADLATSQGPLAGVLRFGDREKAAGVTAAELMTSPPVTAGPDTPLAEAALLMRDRRVKRLPVINATGHLIGVVTRGDVLSVFTRPDADIQREAAEEMIAESFVADSRWLGITVHDGIVTLTGHPETQQAGRDLVEAVRHIDGVIAVKDQLSYAGTPR